MCLVPLTLTLSQWERGFSGWYLFASCDCLPFDLAFGIKTTDNSKRYFSKIHTLADLQLCPLSFWERAGVRGLLIEQPC